MGTTPNLGIPYPEDTDLVIQGDDAMQAIAEKLDTVLDPAWCSGAQETPAFIGSGITVALPIDFGSEHFSIPGPGLIQYTGPTRLFWFSLTVTIGTDTAGRQVVELFHNDTIVLRTNQLQSGGFDGTHVLTRVLGLSSGDEIQANAYAIGASGGVVETTYVSIASVGPAGAV